MNVLVIGGAGYIGSHVTYELCDQGYNVTVLDDLSTGFSDNIDKRADFIHQSFTDFKNLKRAGTLENKSLTKTEVPLFPLAGLKSIMSPKFIDNSKAVS